MTPLSADFFSADFCPAAFSDFLLAAGRVDFFVATFGFATFFVVGFLVGFFVATCFFAAAFFATFFFAADFLAVVFLATFFFAADFLAAVFLATFFFAVFFLAVILPSPMIVPASLRDVSLHAPGRDAAHDTAHRAPG